MSKPIIPDVKDQLIFGATCISAQVNLGLKGINHNATYTKYCIRMAEKMIYKYITNAVVNYFYKDS